MQAPTDPPSLPFSATAEYDRSSQSSTPRRGPQRNFRTSRKFRAQHTDGHRLSPAHPPEEVGCRRAEARANSESRVSGSSQTRPKPDRHRAVRHVGPVTCRSRSPHAPSSRAHPPRTACEQVPKASTPRMITEAILHCGTRRPGTPALAQSGQPARASTRESWFGDAAETALRTPSGHGIAATSGRCSGRPGLTASGAVVRTHPPQPLDPPRR